MEEGKEKSFLIPCVVVAFGRKQVRYLGIGGEPSRMLAIARNQSFYYCSPVEALGERASPKRLAGFLAVLCMRAAAAKYCLHILGRPPLLHDCVYLIVWGSMRRRALAANRPPLPSTTRHQTEGRAFLRMPDSIFPFDWQ
jgi:hypothetical protein